MVIFDEFNKLFPTFKGSSFTNKCHVDECEAEDTGREVRQVTFNNVSGVSIPHNAIKDTTCLYKKGGSTKFMYQDCDGAFCCYDGDILIINLCELKTTPSSEDLCKAKDQIECSFVKLQSLLQHLQSYDGQIKVRGFIAAHEPSLAIKSYFKKPNNPQDRFCAKLLKNKSYEVPKNKLEETRYPIKMPNIKFFFVEVPTGKQRHIVDYSNIV